MASDVVRTVAGARVLRCSADGPLLDGDASAVDLVGTALGRADVVAVPVGRIAPAFFALRTGVAGAVVQRFATYRLHLGVVGDVADRVVASTALRDLVREAYRGHRIWFVVDDDELEARLRAVTA